MKADFECHICSLQAVIRTAQLATDNKPAQEKCLKKALRYLADVSLDQYPPVIARQIYRMIEELTSNFDPFKEMKKEQNIRALKMIEDLRSEIESSDDKLYAAMRLSMAGNCIDCGVGLPEEIEQDVINLVHAEPGRDDYEKMLKILSNAENVLFLCDNAGEIAFDTVFIKEILKRFPHLNLTVAVKSAPIINDATMEDAEFVGMKKLAKVIISCDYPGTVPAESSPEFQKAFNNADFIISKGQGNYETLEDVKQRFVFLLKIKCPIVSRQLEIHEGKQAILVKENS